MKQITTMKNRYSFRLAGVTLVIILAGVCGLTPDARAGNSLCAEVKIEIQQELTLERQAFEAHLRINNGLTNMDLQNVGVTVNFTDEAGAPVEASSNSNSTTATFFIRVNDMTNITDVTGSGTVERSTSADISWLIIPAPNSAGENPQGTLYYVGAALSYTLGGEAHTMDVTPDAIYVKPMPELHLDYFLPKDVYGDDAFTPDIEPPVPFSLGVRVSNQGHGIARNLKIESAQPKIVENDQDVLIDFLITGSEVNGRPATESFLVDFGNLAPETAGAAGGSFRLLRAPRRHRPPLKRKIARFASQA